MKSGSGRYELSAVQETTGSFGYKAKRGPSVVLFYVHFGKDKGEDEAKGTEEREEMGGPSGLSLQSLKRLKDPKSRSGKSATDG